MKLLSFILGCAVFGGCIALIVIEEMCSPQVAMLCTRVWVWCGVVWAIAVLLLTTKNLANVYR